MDKEKLAELVTRVKNGDSAAMDEIYSATAKAVFYYCKCTLGDGNPENAVTKIFNSAEKNIASLDDAGNFIQFLRILTVRYCVSKFSLTSEAWDCADEENLPDVAEVNSDDIINQIVYCDQIKSAIPAMMADLSVPERICAYSYYYFGMSPSQIAMLADVPERIISAHLKSVRFGIKTNMKFYSNLNENEADDLTFSRQLIRDFLYADAAKSVFSALREDSSQGEMRTYSFNVPSKEMIQQGKPAQAGRIQHTSAPVKTFKHITAEKVPNQKRAEEEVIALAHEQQMKSDNAEKKKAVKSGSAMNKKTIIILIVAAVLFVAIIIAGIFIINELLNKEPAVKEVALESLNFKEAQLTVNLGNTYTLIPVFTPDNVTVKDIGWDVQDTEILSLDEKTGQIKANAVGKTLVRAYSLYYTDADENPIFAYCEVTVVCAAEVIHFDNKNVTLEPGDVTTLEPIIYPEAASSSVVWTSSDESVASVSGGKITALKEGVAAITCSYNDSVFDICVINVAKKNIPVTGVKLNKDKAEIKMSDRLQLEATVTPSDATDKTLVWQSSNTEVATVSNNGQVTPVAPGTTLIAVYSDSQMKATGDKNIIQYCEVTVLSDRIAVTEIKILEPSMEMKVGASKYLSGVCMALPDNATNKKLVYFVTNITGNATVDSVGVLQALGEGIVLVQVDSEDNASLSQIITVTITK